MKINDALENYNFYTAKASELTRQLGFAGLAVIWLFKFDRTGMPKLPTFLLLPAALIVLSLFFDFLQYVYGSAAWHVFHDRKEHQVSPDETFFVPKSMLLPAGIFFHAKIIAVSCAYLCLIGYLVHAMA